MAHNAKHAMDPIHTYEASIYEIRYELRTISTKMQFDKRQHPIYLVFQMVDVRRGPLAFTSKPHNALLMKKPLQIQSLRSQTLILVFDSLHSSFDHFEPFSFSLINLTFSIVNCTNSGQVLGFTHFRPTNWGTTLPAI